MVPGDLVITPSWCWHDHANESEVPILWLDSLDAPLVRLLEVGFREDYPDEIQPPGEGNDNSQARYSSGGLRPAWEPAPSTPHTPMCRYPLEQAKAALDRLAAAERDHPTMASSWSTQTPLRADRDAHHRLLHPATAPGRAHRVPSSHLVRLLPRGRGLRLHDDRRPATGLGGKGRFFRACLGVSRTREQSDRPAIVFSVTDIPVKRALGYYREQASPSGRSNFPLIIWKRGRTSLSMPKGVKRPGRLTVPGLNIRLTIRFRPIA